MTHDGHPIVTACVPAWNAGRFLARSLSALAAQDCAGLHVLVSVDASTDDTAAVAARFAAADPRFRVVVQPRRLGWVGNCNALLAAADGDYAAFAPHDDEPPPDYFSRAVTALVEDPGASLAFAEVDWHRESGGVERVGFPDLDGLDAPVARARVLARQLTTDNRWFVPYRGVFRLAQARAIGGLRKHRGGEFAADWPWLMALALRGRFVQLPGAAWRKHFEPGSHSRRLWGTTPPWRRAGAALACFAEIRRARLGFPAQALLAAGLAAGVVRDQGGSAGRKLARGLRPARAEVCIP